MQEPAVTNPQKAKGSAYERLIVNYLREHGFRVDRTRAGWADDKGDIHGITGFTWECKNHRSINLSGWIRELLVECKNAGTKLGAVIHKKRGSTNPGEQYATLPLEMLVQLLKEAGYK
jgi:hypothetical protein